MESEIKIIKKEIVDRIYEILKRIEETHKNLHREEVSEFLSITAGLMTFVVLLENEDTDKNILEFKTYYQLVINALETHSKQNSIQLPNIGFSLN